ncbi:hypothetical protein COLO4_19045 [Corchorus olitorius]|uniref:Tr-type G domain-containing protein n=1 Tax=Corchorus olitorius TaxID=93759 RepID=A0A1R3J6Y0_9ROSI|nr:hypothetical protein COLO4_19045 [Corchorus olitorius]
MASNLKQEDEEEIKQEQFQRLPDDVVMLIINKLIHMKTLIRFSLVAKRYSSLVPKTHSLFVDFYIPPPPTSFMGHLGGFLRNLVAKFRRAPNPITQKLSVLKDGFKQLKHLHLHYGVNPSAAAVSLQSGSCNKWESVYGSKSQFETCVCLMASSVVNHDQSNNSNPSVADSDPAELLAWVVNVPTLVLPKSGYTMNDVIIILASPDDDQDHEAVEVMDAEEDDGKLELAILDGSVLKKWQVLDEAVRVILDDDKLEENTKTLQIQFVALLAFFLRKEGVFSSSTLPFSSVQAPSEEETAKHGVWRCSICTYDNDETMSACDICGVLRGPLVNNSIYDGKRTVGGICKNSGVSTMAKSLFASLPHQMSKKVVDARQQNDGFVVKEDNKFHPLGNSQGQFYEFHKAYTYPIHSRIDIAPFKFDVPSPDDMVSNGLHSSKSGSKANSFDLKSSRVSASVVGKKEAVQIHSSSRSDKSSASMPKGRVDNVDASILAVNPRSSGKSSSSMMPKERQDMVDDSSSSKNRGEAHNLTSNPKNSSLAAKSGHSNDANAGRANSNTQYKPEKWMLPEKAEDSLTQLNLAIVGHVDSGKSTLSGRLLHLLGRISPKEMHKYEKESKLQGKGSFAYAWALDESAEERERGITMTVAVAYFDSKRYHVVVLDSPGHKDFVPNMITGATQADAAILVIDASIGSFEAGMDGTKGQTKEHAQLIRSFGVDQIIVAVNKMDAVEYSKDRFDLIKSHLGTFLRSCGFKDSSVSWIPLSAVENQNLVATPSDVRLSWYQGPYLLDAIDSFQPPTRDFLKPLLMPICDVVKSTSQGQVSACGKLEAGAVRSGSKVLVMPSASIATVRSLERDSQACTVARAGDNVAITLNGVDGNQVMAGDVLCHPDFPVAVAKHLELKLEFHIHHVKEAARVTKIPSLLDSKTGKVTKKAPRCIVAKQSAVVEVILQEPVCVQEFSKCKALGRVFLRTLGRTVAVGIVARIVEEQ